MTDIVLNPITSGYNVARINANFDAIEDTINGEVLHTEGGNNTMYQDLDMNSFALLNVQVDVDNPDSLLTVGDGDARYYNIDGDTLTGTMDVNGQLVLNLPIPTIAHQPVRKDQLDTERSERIQGDQSLYDGYTAADANLQEQISGGAPLEASAFSPISWHDQSIDNSVTIPDNKNAWSFGPTMSISSGQVVTIGTNSYWTIAEGELA